MRVSAPLSGEISLKVTVIGLYSRDSDIFTTYSRNEFGVVLYNRLMAIRPATESYAGCSPANCAMVLPRVICLNGRSYPLVRYDNDLKTDVEFIGR